MKSIAKQSRVELGGPMSVLSQQKADHIKLDRLLQRLAEVPVRDQDAVLLDIYRLVFPHAFAEEAVLWPAMRRVLPDGHELTLRVEREHQQINELVTRLEGLEPGSPEHREVLDRVIGLLREDVRDEEDALLPRLQMKVSPTQLWLLGVAWRAVRFIAPTRAHPIVARRPPGNVHSALPLSVLDRCRDTLDRSLHRGAGTTAPAVRAVSTALAGASHAVEHLPGMRRGEDPSTGIGPGRRLGWSTAMIGTVVAASAVVVLARRRR